MLLLLSPSLALLGPELKKSYVLEVYKTKIFQIASFFSLKLAEVMSRGLNLSFLLQKSHQEIEVRGRFAAPPVLALGLKITGLEKMKRRSNAFCSGSFNHRILDLGYISSLSSAGSLGLKLAMIKS
jgi:hypothetical protein